MKDISFIDIYFDQFQKSSLDKNIIPKIIELKKFLLKTKLNKGKVIIVGNGGSSAIASHVSVDLNKVVGIKSYNFNEYDFITCLANDYGYENWVKKALEIHLEKNDFQPTLGCIAVSRAVMGCILTHITPSTIVHVG